MDLRLLATFQAVVEQGSLNAAAAELGFAQSTVTQQIQQLEAKLGVQLFHREGKRVRISEAGLMLKKHAEDLLRRAEDVENLLAHFASGAGGRVRIGAVEPFETTHLPAVLRAFLREPNSIETSVEIGATHALYKGLEAGELDLIIAPPNRMSGVHFEPLFFERLAFLIPASLPLARKRTISVADVLSQRLVLSSHACEFRMAFERALSNSTIPLLPSITITNVEGQKAAARAGLGVAMIPLAAARPVPPETVLRTPIEKNLGITIGLARRAEALMTPAMSRLESIIRKRMADTKVVTLRTSGAN